MAQPTPPHMRLQYLNSAPAVAASPTVASPRPIANSSHTSVTRQTHPTYGSCVDSPASNSTPRDAHHDPGFNTDGQPAEDQWQDAASSLEIDHGSPNGQQPEPLQNGLAEHAPSSQQPEGPADSPVAGGSQHLKVNASKQDAIKRLTAKRAALSGFASVVPSVQSPFRAAGLRHSTLSGKLCICACAGCMFFPIGGVSACPPNIQKLCRPCTVQSSSRLHEPHVQAQQRTSSDRELYLYAACTTHSHSVIDFTACAHAILLQNTKLQNRLKIAFLAI